ncbi:YgfZ/GcvT domain-containing protein [Marinomonas algicola]|uniref:CAF17-like 4Fe-4S cluster assembly/insertion protein YgfZ n=1 Tax=Marinomonas algicola TaxID=2773454 RepID=UPI00174D5500|nr:folate-binding protein YgfZ [Marinomonas algicola]
MNDLFTSLKDEFVFPCLSQRRDLGVLQFEGVDSSKFLQGQTTCDLTNLTPENALLGAICNIKGQVVSSFYLIHYADCIFMVLSQDLVEKTQLHLKKFAVFFKTSITDVTAQFTIHSLFDVDSSLLHPTPQVHKPCVIKDDGIYVQLHTAPMTHGIELRPIKTLNNEMHKDLPLSQAQALLSLFAEPLITSKDSEKFLPNMLNMQFTNGISFKKGCYTGQEIVARVHYRGKTKKRLYLASLEQPIDLTSTSLLNESKKEVGDILEVNRINNKSILLAVININDTDTPLNVNGIELRLHSLPYSVE